MNSYQQMLAKLSAEQRAEWDRCVEIFARKFGAEVDAEANAKAAQEWEDHDCAADRCVENSLQRIIDGLLHKCLTCWLEWKHDIDPILKCEHAADAESPEGRRLATAWAEEELRILAE